MHGKKVRSYPRSAADQAPDQFSFLSTMSLSAYFLKDEIVPFEHAVKIFNKSPVVVEPLWIEHGNHNNLNTTYKQVSEVVPKPSLDLDSRKS